MVSVWEKFSFGTGSNLKGVSNSTNLQVSLIGGLSNPRDYAANA